MATPYAFVTLVSSDSYLHGALALAAALSDIHPSPTLPPEVDFQTVCLVTPETVDVSAIRLLRTAFDAVVGVEVITQQDETGLALLGRLDLNTVLTKLHVFRLTQFSKIIFLDADILPIRPLSHLFTLPHDFSASPDVGWPDIFNSGVMVLSPGEEKFNELTELLKSKGSWDGGDQGILNEWRGGNWNRLSFTYNTTPTAAYTYAPAYERFGSQISAIHFIGAQKPWESISYRSPFSGQRHVPSDSRQQAYDYNSLVDRWYAVYDKHYRSPTTTRQSQNFEIKRYQSAWNENSHSESSESAPESILSLEELKRLAIGGMNAASHASYKDQLGDLGLKKGQYYSMPLLGRIDLMRPANDSHTSVTALMLEEEPPSLTSQRGSNDEGNKENAVVVTLPDTVPDDDPRTPVTRHAEFPDDTSPPSRTLTTPGPNEIPPSPHPHPIPLPPSTPCSEFESSPFPTPSVLDSPSQRPSRRLESRQRKGQYQTSIDLSTQKVPIHYSENKQHHDPPRPHSPNMLLWNPAVDPPPTETPNSSAFPSSTYFPNAWDSSKHLPHTPEPSAGALFEPFPLSEIPEPLIKQGHYRSVTGEEQHGAIPSPDQTKVKHVFPWEEKPRYLPGRVFPVIDSPKPALFLSPESQSSQTSSDLPATPEMKTIRPSVQMLSPLHGFPTSLVYPNAWDNVPSIQKYASKLAHSPPRPLAPPFDEDVWNRKAGNWDERAEASSRDGDVEDEGEDSGGEEVNENALWNDDSDPESVKALERRSRRASTIGIGGIPLGKYRDFGVQTITRDMKAQAVQTIAPPLSPSKQRSTHGERRPTLSDKRHWAPATRSNVPPTVTVQNPPVIPDSQRQLPSLDSQSPRTTATAPSSLTSPPFLLGIRPSHITTPSSKAPIRPQQPPVSRTAPVIIRQASNDSSLGSPASSIGPISPSDGQPIASPRRIGGRVWDPARGVELFKRGSEEVLARFLKMGSWEDESH